MAYNSPSPATPRRLPMPTDYRQQFLQLALQYRCLEFGEFHLKSGRISPYFFNAGAFNDGAALEQLGAFYTQATMDAGLEFDMLFGPAYKGIPLATAAACAFQRSQGRAVPVGFDRKEAKTHGDQGRTFGAPIAGRVLLVDDVISSGATILGSVELIRSLGATPAGLITLMDRGERGEGLQSAAKEVAEQCAMPVVSVARAADFRWSLRNAPEYRQYHDQVETYLKHYGA